MRVGRAGGTAPLPPTAKKISPSEAEEDRATTAPRPNQHPLIRSRAVYRQVLSPLPLSVAVIHFWSHGHYSRDSYPSSEQR